MRNGHTSVQSTLRFCVVAFSYIEKKRKADVCSVALEGRVASRQRMAPLSKSKPAACDVYAPSGGQPVAVLLCPASNYPCGCCACCRALLTPRTHAHNYMRMRTRSRGAPTARLLRAVGQRMCARCGAEYTVVLVLVARRKIPTRFYGYRACKWTSARRVCMWCGWGGSN